MHLKHWVTLRIHFHTFDCGVTEYKTTVTARRAEVPPRVWSFSVFRLLEIRSTHAGDVSCPKVLMSFR